MWLHVFTMKGIGYIIRAGQVWTNFVINFFGSWWHNQLLFEGMDLPSGLHHHDVWCLYRTCRPRSVCCPTALKLTSLTPNDSSGNGLPWIYLLLSSLHWEIGLFSIPPGRKFDEKVSLNICDCKVSSVLHSAVRKIDSNVPTIALNATLGTQSIFSFRLTFQYYANEHFQ